MVAEKDVDTTKVTTGSITCPLYTFLMLPILPKVSPLSFLNSSPHLSVAVSVGFVLLPIFALKSPVTSGLVSLKYHRRLFRSYSCIS